MHGQNCLGAWRDPPGGVAQIEIETDGARIDENGFRADARHASGRGEKGEARAEHLVARTDLQRHQREQDRVRAGTDAEDMFRAGEFGQHPLEAFDFRA
jgi:hypothetical protein